MRFLSNVALFAALLGLAVFTRCASDEVASLPTHDAEWSDGGTIDRCRAVTVRKNGEPQSAASFGAGDRLDVVALSVCPDLFPIANGGPDLAETQHGPDWGSDPPDMPPEQPQGDAGASRACPLPCVRGVCSPTLGDGLRCEAGCCVH